ncbi:H+-transporting ATPase [Planctomycetaceae bacterium]|nr:H+-transporting ATPase [Planctomycetaceae bacterium]
MKNAHALSAQATLSELQSSPTGLSRAEAAARLAKYGPNTLPSARPPGVVLIFGRQFLSPLIYVLLAAALVSVFMGHWSDAGFILAVLMINAAIGTIQEYNAQRAADALRRLSLARAMVQREGEDFEIDAKEIVPGDIVLLETGAKVPADLRLLSSSSLEVDESLLTGESLAAAKDANAQVSADATLGDRASMVFAGTLVTRGRARGLCVSTALHTELGGIAQAVLAREDAKPPLMVRMESFTRKLAFVALLLVLIVAAIALWRGYEPGDVFLVSVALAVSAIPEGLPVALTVALAIAMARMGKRNVIVRKLVAVEALGSCTFIASDKTGTLTLNELTVRRLNFGAESWEVSGEGMIPDGEVHLPADVDASSCRALAERLARAGALCNEGFLGRRNGVWTHHGDAVDVALLVLAHKLNISRAALEAEATLLASIPFESERQYAATLHKTAQGQIIYVKGALEKLLPMCAYLATPMGDVPMETAKIEQAAHELADGGYRVLAVAQGAALVGAAEFVPARLGGLTLLGLVGIIDPLRKDARQAIADCRKAGIEVAMVTGDHPRTALAIARELDLVQDFGRVLTGPQMRALEGSHLDAAIAKARVFARVDPTQKTQIVQALTRQGHFVAVTGDGANDAPALRAAHVGVAMGKSGTDVARETAELIITDDAFSSIVAGIQEGRVAYANIRKVIYMQLSTGAAEIGVVMAALALGFPVPFFAVQLLWLNLVTNGIQDVALAFEPGEGDELSKKPRSPGEAVLNRSMIRRVLLSSAWMALVCVGLFGWLLDHGYCESAARNLVLLLLVLFENIQIGNCRSETRSAFALSPFRNRILLFGTLGTQALHVAAMHTPGLNTLLGIHPVSLLEWLAMLGLALTVLVVMEVYKGVAQVAAGRARLHVAI